MGKVIGIDLGTTNSVVSIMEGGEPTVIPNQEGNRTTPSIVGFTPEGEKLVGVVAKRQAVTNPTNTIYSVKRFMGRRHDEVPEEVKMVPYEVIKAENGDARLKINGKVYAPPEISSSVLQKLKQAASDYLGEEVTDAVVTVPAYFNDSQRQATTDAGKIAGLNVLRIINEPTAAALAYGLDKKQDQTIAVYDFGGGTFDVSILEVGDNVVEVKATNGDTHLGGDNIDQQIIEWLVDEFKKDQGIDLSSDPMALQRLREESEKAKIELSSSMETDINLPFITADSSGPKHLNIKISRSKLEQLAGDLVERTLLPCRQSLNDANLQPGDIDEVVLVGGSTRMPLVQETVKKFFSKEPHKGVNPDEVVAVGAAVQGGVLAGDVKDVLLLDVTPLSLGIETLGNVCTKLIERNTTIPVKKSETFSTAADNQTSVEVHVLQGEREMAADNRSLGKFHLVDIPSAPRGVPQIEVTFDIDANGIVNVSAKDLGTGKEQAITITSSSGISEDEINNMVRDAEENAGEDKKRRDLVESRNNAESLAYSTEKMLSENNDKVSEEDKKAIEDAIAEVRKVLDSQDASIEEIDSSRSNLETVSHKLSQAMYEEASKQANTDSGGQPNDSESGNQVGEDDGDVVDAEFEEVKKDK